MLVSELADRADVPLATVKYYLREGLLPAGETTGPRRAEYDETHVRRLRVLRLLREVGGVPVTSLRQVIDALEDEELPVHEVMTLVADVISDDPELGQQDPAALEVVDEVLAADRLGRRPPGVDRPAAAGRAGVAAQRTRDRSRPSVEILTFYAAAADSLARAEIALLDHATERSAAAGADGHRAPWSTVRSSGLLRQLGPRAPPRPAVEPGARSPPDALSRAIAGRAALSCRQTAAAVERLRLSARPGIGIRTRWSASAARLGGQPVRLVAEHPGRRPGQQLAGVVEAQLAGAVRGEHHQPAPGGPRRPQPPDRARGPPARGTRCRRSPAPSWGCRGRPSCPASTTAWTPNASEVRTRVPALPGSRMSAAIVTSPLGRGAAASARSSGTSRNEHTATIPAGLTLSLSEASARSSTTHERGAAATSAAYCSRGGERHEQLDDDPPLEGALDRLGAVGKEQPPLGAHRTAAELARLLDPAVAGGQGRLGSRQARPTALRRPWGR